jgi:hypothetical protein
MKNTLLVSASFTALVLAFLLREANLAIDASDDLTYRMVADAYTSACIYHSDSMGYFDCKPFADGYIQDIKARGW